MTPSQNTRGRRWTRIIAGAAIVIGAVLSQTPQRADAHASLLGSTPSYGDVLETPPGTMELVFDSPVDPRLVRMSLRTVEGEDLGEAERTDDAVGTQVTFTLPKTDDGVFEVVWQAFSYDGHIVGGVIRYTVGEETEASAGGGPDSGAVSSSGDRTERLYKLLEIQLRFASYVVLSLMMGALLWIVFDNGATGRFESLRRIAIVSGWVLASTAALRALIVTLNARSSLKSLEATWNALAGSGQLIWAIVVVGAVHATLAARRSADVKALGALSVYSFAAAAAGHANGSTIATGVFAGIHLLAAGAWGGAVGALAIVRGFKSTLRFSEIREPLDKLSFVMLSASGILVATGARNAWVLSGDALPVGTWATLLGLKLLLAGGAVALGAWHLWRGRQGARVPGSVVIEAAVIAQIVAVAALLAATPPV